MRFLIDEQLPSEKMIYVATGNIKNRELLTLFRLHIMEVTKQLQVHNVIELNKFGMHVLH